MKFPQYTREQNKRCKLSDEQILEARQRFYNGESLAEIGRSFGVTYVAISWWIKTDEERKLISKRRYQAAKSSGYVAPIKQDPREYRKRKKELQPELLDYENKSAIRYRTENPEQYRKSSRKSDKKYLEKNKETIYARNLEYRKQRREKLRLYAIEYRRKKKEEILQPKEL